MEKILPRLSDPDLRIVFAGIGNVLRNDDGVGPFIAARIKTRDNWVVLIPESGLERYISAITREKPDLLLILDCVEFWEPPGFWKPIPIGQVVETSLHSHNISLQRLSAFFDSETWVIGVQPGDMRVGESLSGTVRRSAEEIISIINRS
ncbi:MAG: hydrogenase maturation protease [Bacteroidales bacterium]